MLETWCKLVMVMVQSVTHQDLSQWSLVVIQIVDHRECISQRKYCMILFFKHDYGAMGIRLSRKPSHRSNIINQLSILWLVSCWWEILQQEYEVGSSINYHRDISSLILIQINKNTVKYADRKVFFSAQDLSLKLSARSNLFRSSNTYALDSFDLIFFSHFLISRLFFNPKRKYGISKLWWTNGVDSYWNSASFRTKEEIHKLWVIIYL